MKVVTKIINDGVEVDSFSTSEVHLDGFRSLVPVDTSKLMLEIYDSETSTSSRVSYKKLDRCEDILGVVSGEELVYLFKCNKNFVRVYGDLEVVSSDYYTGEILEYDRFMEDMDSVEITQYWVDAERYENCLHGMSPINAIYIAVEHYAKKFVSESSDDFIVNLNFDNGMDLGLNDGAFRNCGCLSITAKIADRKSFNKDIVKYAIPA